MTEGYIAVVIELPNEDRVVRFRRVRCPAGDGASLKFLQKVVGGYIEHIGTPDGQYDYWVNEEGKLQGLRINNCATDLLGTMWPDWRGWDVLCGNVVITGNKGPETVDAPEGLWEMLQRAEWLNRVEFVDEIEGEG